MLCNLLLFSFIGLFSRGFIAYIRFYRKHQRTHHVEVVSYRVPHTVQLDFRMFKLTSQVSRVKCRFENSGLCT